MTLTYQRDDSLLPALEPGHHAYAVRDTSDRLRGVVASGSATTGRCWWAYRWMPSRTRRLVAVATGPTRESVAHALTVGRP